MVAVGSKCAVESVTGNDIVVVCESTRLVMLLIISWTVDSADILATQEIEEISLKGVPVRRCRNFLTASSERSSLTSEAMVQKISIKVMLISYRIRLYTVRLASASGVISVTTNYTCGSQEHRKKYCKAPPHCVLCHHL